MPHRRTEDPMDRDERLVEELRHAVARAVETNGPAHVLKPAKIPYPALRRFLAGHAVRPHNLTLLWRWAADHGSDDDFRSAAARVSARRVPELPPILAGLDSGR